MTYAYFSHNGSLLPADQAVVPLNSVEYSYGFGVYETIRVSKGKIFFLEEHCQRLLNSAEIIGLTHIYTKEFVAQSIQELIAKNKVESCNVKVLLIGGQTPDLYVQCLNPLFPDRTLYKRGAHCITEPYERAYPHAKTLNMLPSYLAYRRAQQQAAYDALLVDHAGNITEGTRTNFFGLKGRTIISPPEADILLGVMRSQVLKVARDEGFKVAEQAIPLASIGKSDAAFLTSTSSKIMPIRSIDGHSWPEIAPALRELMTALDAFLDAC